MEVGPSLSSFFGLLRLSWLLCRLVLLTCWSCCVGGVDCSRPEPWTRLHCSELHWRVPVALPVGQPGAPVSSKGCAHGSFSSCGSEAIWLAHSSGEWCYFWISWLTQWYCYAAMHCRYFAETKTLWEHLNSPAATIQLLRPRDIACFGEEFTAMASMSSDDVVLTMLDCACDVFPFDVAQQSCPP